MNGMFGIEFVSGIVSVIMVVIAIWIGRCPILRYNALSGLFVFCYG